MRIPRLDSFTIREGASTAQAVHSPSRTASPTSGMELVLKEVLLKTRPPIEAIGTDASSAQGKQRTIMEKLGDTNVFYDLAASRVAPEDVVGEGETLVISPMSVLEIASRITDDNFEERRAAAQAALKHSQLVEDPEQLLERIWAVPTQHAAVGDPWRDGLIAIADAADLAELTAGVNDWQQRVVRTVNVGHAGQWRSSHYDDFVTQMELAADNLVPGYKKKREAGLMKQANKETRERVATTLAAPGVLGEIIVATRMRAWMGQTQTVMPPMSQAEFSSAIPPLFPYALAYRSYLELVATEFAPKPNDWGDLECFLYVNDDRLLVTSDERWHKVAVFAGIDKLVVRPGD